MPIKTSTSPPFKLFHRLVRSVETNGMRGALVRSCQRLFRSLWNHGLSGTWERAFRKAPAAVEIAGTQQTHPFDLRYGVDTSGCISNVDLQGMSLSSLYSTVYLGVAPSTLIQAISRLPLSHEDFTFVDLGCGKGRALLLAAQFPFRRLVGVEIAPELCAVAQANVVSKPEWAARVSILNQDATDITYPDKPLVIFMYHPFYAKVLRRVLANLERQLRRFPRETYLLYADNPRYTDILDRFPFLREISETAYALASEDAIVQYEGLTHENYTLYHADMNF